MKAVDTNVLVYAMVDAGPFHPIARELLVDLAEGSRPWAIPWPCIYECLRVVTHARVFDPPVPPDQALAEIEMLLASPTVVVLHETDRHLRILKNLLAENPPLSGNLMHDAHIAVLCIEHGVSSLVTGDSDFLRFGALDVENPFGG